METINMKLFIAGESLKSSQALTSIFQLQEKYEDIHFNFEVIDINEFPEEGDKEKILATPTLIIQNKNHLKRLVGDLSNREVFSQALQFISD